MARLRILLTLGALLVFSACDPGPGADPLSEELLGHHGIRTSGATSTQAMEVWESAEDGMPWDAYLEASQEIGLDFSSLRGERALLRTTPIEGSAPGMRAHVLVRNGAVVGAWLSTEDDATGSSAIASLDDPPSSGR